MTNTPFFGPGGNSDSFRLWGGRSTVDAPRFVSEIGLNAYEYEAGRGIVSSDETLAAIGAEAKKYGVRMSLHTPYFISLSGVEIEKRLKSLDYIRESIAAAHLLGAKTIVVHAGSASKISRDEAMRLASDTLFRAAEEFDGCGIRIGIETMGKKNQLGTLDEVIELCRIAPIFVPIVDFGHLNARECGGVFSDENDYYAVFERIGSALGDDVAQDLHCHFSKIEWTASGEKKHLTFADTIYGPAYEPLMSAIAAHGLSPTIISESAGTQSDDALAMSRYYHSVVS